MNSLLKMDNGRASLLPPLVIRVADDVEVLLPGFRWAKNSYEESGFAISKGIIPRKWAPDAAAICELPSPFSPRQAPVHKRAF